MGRLILGLAVFFGGHSISLLALGWRDRMAERLGTNDVIAVVGGLATYAAFILGLHARWFGVPVLAVSL